MAVIQISKMQVRRGQTAQTGFPQLSSGELGWSIDTQELYIGNGSVEEGAPAIGNTQLITEHNVSNFFLYGKTGYIYKDGSAPAGDATYRTIQSKLDDFVTLYDFGDIVTATDHTSIIKNAIKYAAQVKKPLYIPEQQYSITATIYIPPYTELRGAGAGKTVINNLSSTATFQTQDATGLTGLAITSGANVPKNIRINGITFVNGYTTNASPILQLDCISDSIVEQCEFIGTDTVTTATASAINLRGVGNVGANITDNVTIKNCVFTKMSSAIVSDYDISNITIKENKFKTLYRGIVFGLNSTGTGYQEVGPSHVQIEGNTFDTISRQAVYAGSTSSVYSTDINSVNNYYVNCGSNGLGDYGTSTQVTGVIQFNAFGNYSSGDTFDRIGVINSGTQFLSGTSIAKPIVTGPVTLESKGPNVFVLPGSITSNPQPFFGLPRSAFTVGSNSANQLITVEYTINKPHAAMLQRGTLEIMVSSTTATIKDTYMSTVSIADESLPSPPERVSFSTAVNSLTNIVSINITNNTTATSNVTNKGNIIYTYTVRQ